MSARFRWVTVLSLTVLLMMAGVLPAAAHRGLPPATPVDTPKLSPTVWGTGAVSPTAGWLMGGASVDGCTFYAIGGNLPGSVAVATVSQYDPASDAWTPRSSMPEGLYGIQPTAAGTKVYVVGGYPDVSTGLYAVNSTNIYDSLLDSWSTGTPIPVGVNGIGTAAQAVWNGKVYVIGGDDGDYVSNNTTYEYTIATDSWALRAPMTTARENNVAVTLNDKIYVAGGAEGADPNYTGMTTFEVYDPVADTWDTLAPMQVARVSPGIATDGTYVYVYGGADSLGATFSSLDSAERYDPATDTWTYIDTMAQSAGGMVAAYAAGRIYSAGGLTSVSGSYTRINTNQYLTVGSNNCEPTAVQLTDLSSSVAAGNTAPLWLLTLLAVAAALIVTRRLPQSR